MRGQKEDSSIGGSSAESIHNAGREVSLLQSNRVFFCYDHVLTHCTSMDGPQVLSMLFGSCRRQASGYGSCCHLLDHCSASNLSYIV